MPSLIQQKPELLMVGIGAKTYRIGNTVKKVHRIDDEEAITAQNIEAARNEASIYILLGEHRRIAKCLAVGPARSYIELEFYSNGTLKAYVDKHRATLTDAYLKRWTRQMIEAIIYIHAMGVTHSDLRLDQWLLDRVFDARLSDFNGSGYERNTALELEGCKPLGIEISSHYLPRDPMADNTVESDIFALGSSLYELVAGEKPYETLTNEKIEALFSQGTFPSIEKLLFGQVIMGCWKREYTSAKDVLEYCEDIYGF